MAAFDVDGTLTTRDCVRPFLTLVVGRRGLARVLVARSGALVAAMAQTDRDRIKELVVGGALTGRRVDEVSSLGGGFARRVHDRWLRPDTVGRLRWHQRSGHRVVLVSASLGPYLRPLGERLGVDAVLCTDARSAGGVYVDGLDGGNCRGAEKVRRLDEWLTATGARDAVVWAYGDSAGDRDLLARADRAEVVGRRRMPTTPRGEST